VGSPQAQEEWIQIPWRGREPGLRSWEYIDFVAVGGYSMVQIVYPKRFDIVELSEEEPGGGVFDLGFAVVDIMDSSDKYVRVSARFTKVRHDTVVYVSWEPAAGRVERRAYLLRPGGWITEVAVRTKTIEEAGRAYVVFYVEYKNTEIELERKPASEEEVAVKRLTVKIEKAGGKVVVRGDTYHVKDTLKGHGFRWDPQGRVWYKEAADVNAIANAIKALGVNVVVG